jgi:hypothetical protein
VSQLVSMFYFRSSQLNAIDVAVTDIIYVCAG